VQLTLVHRPNVPALGRIGRALLAWFRLFRVLRRRRERVIHLHLDLLVCPLLARMAGCRRVVVSVHNDERYYARRAWRWWLRIVGSWTSQFIAITKHVATYFERQSGVPADRIHVVYYGVPEVVPDRHARSTLGLSEGVFTVGFVGRLTAQKDVSTLLEAVALAPGTLCVLIGEGEERPMLERKAAQLGISNRVKFMGAVIDASRYMAAFDVFCLPSRWEGLGLVLVEAMLQRVPIVASEAGAIPEVLDGCGWLCRPGHPEEFAAAIGSIRQALPQVSERVAAGEHHARSRFVIDKMLEATEAVYDRVTSAAPDRVESY